MPSVIPTPRSGLSSAPPKTIVAVVDDDESIRRSLALSIEAAAGRGDSTSAVPSYFEL